MSEQEPTSFMQELDRWTDANVIGPVFNTDPNQEEDWEWAVAAIKKAIRTKVLESYRNGQAAGGRQPVRRERGYAQAQAR